MLGFNTDKVVQAEIDSKALNRRGKMNEWDWGDDVRAGFYGLFGKDYRRKTLEKLAREKQTQAYNDELSGINKKLEQYRPGTVITRQEGETLADMKARGNLEVALGQQIAAGKLTNPKADFSGVQSFQDLNAVIGQDNQRQIDKVETERLEDKSEANRRYYADRTERLEDKSEADRRYYADRQDARRSENRRYELEIMRLQQADKQKAQDRRDRMIMTLMSGLNNLGQAFTI